MGSVTAHFMSIQTDIDTCGGGIVINICHNEALTLVMLYASILVVYAN